MTRSSNPLLELRRLGQSPWCDQLSRQLLESGELERLVDLGVVGLTSNPTIFQKAIGGGDWYDSQVSELLREGVEEPKEIYE
ncbi:MAG: transaldolase, partial [Chloroflexota bacterium]